MSSLPAPLQPQTPAEQLQSAAGSKANPLSNVYNAPPLTEAEKLGIDVEKSTGKPPEPPKDKFVFAGGPATLPPQTVIGNLAGGPADQKPAEIKSAETKPAIDYTKLALPGPNVQTVAFNTSEGVYVIQRASDRSIARIITPTGSTVGVAKENVEEYFRQKGFSEGGYRMLGPTEMKNIGVDIRGAGGGVTTFTPSNDLAKAKEQLYSSYEPKFSEEKGTLSKEGISVPYQFVSDLGIKFTAVGSAVGGGYLVSPTEDYLSQTIATKKLLRSKVIAQDVFKEMSKTTEGRFALNIGASGETTEVTDATGKSITIEGIKRGEQSLTFKELNKAQTQNQLDFVRRMVGEEIKSAGSLPEYILKFPETIVESTASSFSSVLGGGGKIGRFITDETGGFKLTGYESPTGAAGVVARSPFGGVAQIGAAVATGEVLGIGVGALSNEVRGLLQTSIGQTTFTTNIPSFYENLITTGERTALTNAQIKTAVRAGDYIIQPSNVRNMVYYNVGLPVELTKGNIESELTNLITGKGGGIVRGVTVEGEIYMPRLQAINKQTLLHETIHASEYNVEGVSKFARPTEGEMVADFMKAARGTDIPEVVAKAKRSIGQIYKYKEPFYATSSIRESELIARYGQVLPMELGTPTTATGRYVADVLSRGVVVKTEPTVKIPSAISSAIKSISGKPTYDVSQSAISSKDIAIKGLVETDVSRSADIVSGYGYTTDVTRKSLFGLRKITERFETMAPVVGRVTEYPAEKVVTTEFGGVAFSGKAKALEELGSKLKAGEKLTAKESSDIIAAQGFRGRGIGRAVENAQRLGLSENTAESVVTGKISKINLEKMTAEPTGEFGGRYLSTALAESELTQRSAFVGKTATALKEGKAIVGSVDTSQGFATQFRMDTLFGRSFGGGGAGEPVVSGDAGGELVSAGGESKRMLIKNIGGSGGADVRKAIGEATASALGETKPAVARAAIASMSASFPAPILPSLREVSRSATQFLSTTSTAVTRQAQPQMETPSVSFVSSRMIELPAQIQSQSQSGMLRTNLYTSQAQATRQQEKLLTREGTLFSTTQITTPATRTLLVPRITTLLGSALMTKQAQITIPTYRTLTTEIPITSPNIIIPTTTTSKPSPRKSMYAERKTKRELSFKTSGKRPANKMTRAIGIISESQSRKLFGRATLGKTYTAGSSTTKELENIGITSPAQYLERGGAFSTFKFNKNNKKRRRKM